jgi:hypothetical protein
LQAELQQTPSTQNDDAQCEPEVQGAPLASSARQACATVSHHPDTAHCVSSLQDVLHELASPQTKGAQLLTSMRHEPLPSHEPVVSCPPTQLGARHDVPAV